MGFFDNVRDQFASCFGRSQAVGDQTPLLVRTEVSATEKTSIAITAAKEALPFLFLAYAFYAFMVVAEEDNAKHEHVTLSIGMLQGYEAMDALGQLSKIVSPKDSYEFAMALLLCFKSLLAFAALVIAAKGDDPDLPPQLFLGVVGTLTLSSVINAFKDVEHRVGHVINAGLFATVEVSLGVGLVAGKATQTLGYAALAALGGLFAKTTVQGYQAKVAQAAGMTPSLNL